MSTLRSFEDLECWKKCRIVRIEFSRLIKTFPDDEKFALISQIKRASRSATNNIAEGYGRFHYRENMQFCRISRGSLYELLDHLDIALEEKYISEEIFGNLKNLISEGIVILNGYINYLERAAINK